jgi:hypothetical protein
MKRIEIYDPAMCCSTGVCGPSIDTELLRVSTLIRNLEKNGIKIERHNLTSDPQAFIDNKVINGMLDKDGVDVLPVTIVDGEVVKTKNYLTNDEFVKFLNIPESYLNVQEKVDNQAKVRLKGCGCKGGCC